MNSLLSFEMKSTPKIIGTRILVFIFIATPWLFMFYTLLVTDNTESCQLHGIPIGKDGKWTLDEEKVSTCPGGAKELAGGCHGIMELQEKLDSSFKSFDKILSESTSDKKKHNYGPMYSEYLDAIKNEKVNFMEIGLRQGDSITLWKSFFPRARLFGIDKGQIFQGFKKQIGDPNVSIFIGDQANVTFLNDIIDIIKKEAGELDFIIDDGGHTMTQQIVSLTTLFPIVKPGGYYFIEDLETSYYDKPCGYGCYNLCCGGGKPGKKGTTIDLIKSFIDVLNEDFIKGPNKKMKWGINRYSVNKIDHMIGSIQCWRNMCVLRKKRLGSYF